MASGVKASVCMCVSFCVCVCVCVCQCVCQHVYAQSVVHTCKIGARGYTDQQHECLNRRRETDTTYTCGYKWQVEHGYTVNNSPSA